MDKGLYIGEAIRRGRREKKLTQKELARLLGISPSVVSFWESNTRVPAGDVLIKVARLLEIVDLLFLDYEVRKKDNAPAHESSLVTATDLPSMLREEIVHYRRETSELRQELQEMKLQIQKLGEKSTDA